MFWNKKKEQEMAEFLGSIGFIMSQHLIHEHGMARDEAIAKASEYCTMIEVAFRQGFMGEAVKQAKVKTIQKMAEKLIAENQWKK